MHDRRRATLTDSASHRVDVGCVALDERRTERRFAVAGTQVVVDDDVMTRLAQGLGGVASDVAGATGDQNGGRLSGGQWSNR